MDLTRWKESQLSLLPDLARGTRAALATLVPFYLAAVTGRRELAWVAIGGWIGTLADPGGTRADRARVLVEFMFAGAATVAVATFASAWSLASVVFVALASFVFSLMRAFGGTATTIGSLLLVVGAIAAARSGANALVNGVAFGAGALWATILSSVVWPVWTHLPVRVAVDRAWRELGIYAAAVEATLDAPPGDPRWAELARTYPGRVRSAIEQARVAALANRAKTGGESRVGSGLRVSLGVAEAVFPILIALTEEIESSPDREEARAYLRAFEGRLSKLEIPETTSTTPITKLGKKLVSASEKRVGNPGEGEEQETATVDGSFAATLRSALDPRSITFRHSVRVTIAATIAGFVGAKFSPEHSYWVTVTTIAVLQPFPGATVRRALERVVGTVLGSGLAIVIGIVIKSPVGLSMIMIPLSIAAVATKPRSYRLFTFFLTPVFVLLAERWHGDWETGLARAIDTTLGGGVALICALIFASWESPRLADAMDKALDALRAYCDGVFREHREQPVLRRQVGLTLAEVESSLERMLAEPLRSKEEATRIMQLVTYARRLSAAVTTVAVHGEQVPDDIADYVRGAIDRAHRKRDEKDAVDEALRAPNAKVPALARLVTHAELLASEISER